MKRKDVEKMFPDATEDQVTQLLNQYNADVKKVKDGAAAEKEELERLREVEKELEEERNEKLTAEEKLQKAEEAARTKEIEFLKKSNMLEVEKVFLEAGMVKADYEGFIDQIVSEDADASLNLANSLVKTVTAQKEAAVKAAREEDLDGTPGPDGAGGSGSGDDKDEAEKMAEKLAAANTATSGAAQKAAEYYGG